MVDDGRLTAAQKLPGETSTYLFDDAELDRALGADVAAQLDGETRAVTP
jgi:hypothetical protein